MTKMRKIVVSILGLALFILAGCATPLPEMDSDRLCQHFGNNFAGQTDRVPSIRAELQSRKLINERDWAFVERRELYVGMTICPMFAIQGSPVTQNSTTTSAGTSIQHVFVNYNTLKREYVYTSNGRVTAWQK